MFYSSRGDLIGNNCQRVCGLPVTTNLIEVNAGEFANVFGHLWQIKDLLQEIVAADWSSISFLIRRFNRQFDERQWRTKSYFTKSPKPFRILRKQLLKFLVPSIEVTGVSIDIEALLWAFTDGWPQEAEWQMSDRQRRLSCGSFRAEIMRP